MGSSNDMTTTGSRRSSSLVKPDCAKEIDLSLGRQEVNAVIFAAKLMVGMSFVIILSSMSSPGSEEMAFSFVLCRSLERILFSGFCNSLASST